MEKSEMPWSFTDTKNTNIGDSFWSFGKEQNFKPHMRHVEPVLTECDLDWKSSLRWIPEPRYNDAPFPHIKDIKFPSERKLMRSFPQANMVSGSEWSFYPNLGQPKTYHTGKRCFMDGINHTRSMRCISEKSLESFIGRKKHVTDKCSLYPSRKVRPFLIPEYSSDFHKNGSTLHTNTFGSGSFGTFKSFKTPKKGVRQLIIAEKHKSHALEEEIVEVQRLNSWRPAPDIYDRADLQNYRTPNLEGIATLTT